MYCAVVLHPKDAHILKEFVSTLIDTNSHKLLFETQTGITLPHHCTIDLGKFDEELNSPDILDKEAFFTVDKLMFNEEVGACAANVVNLMTVCGLPIKTRTGNPHVTCCLKENVPPKMSLKLFESECKNIPLNLKLSGITQIVQ